MMVFRNLQQLFLTAGWHSLINCNLSVLQSPTLTLIPGQIRTGERRKGERTGELEWIAGPLVMCISSVVDVPWDFLSSVGHRISTSWLRPPCVVWINYPLQSVQSSLFDTSFRCSEKPCYLVTSWYKVKVCVRHSVMSDYLWPHGLSMEFSRQEDWSGLPLPSSGDLPDPGIEPRFPALQADFCHLSSQGSPKLV